MDRMMEPIPAIPQPYKEPTLDFYHYSLCHFCKEIKPELKRCVKCKVVYYCSRDHQVQDWLTHKDVCRHLTTVKEQHVFTPCLDADTFTMFKMQGALLLSVLLGYPVTGALSDMFMHPKVCAVCHTEDVDGVCPDCLSVAYCSEVHKTIMERKHSRHCKALKDCLDELVEAHKKTPRLCGTHLIPIFPEDVESLPKDHNEVVKILKVLPEDLLKPDSLMLSGLIAYATNMINALESVKVVEKRRMKKNKLLIHIVATEQILNTDWFFLIEFLAHWIVNLKAVRIVFIGRNVPTLEMFPDIQCDRCKSAQIKRGFLSISRDYSEVFQVIPKPDLVALYHQVIESSFLPYIKSGVPVVMTAESGPALIESTQLFPSSQIRYILRPTENKYASSSPMRNMLEGEEPVLYRHKFVAIFIKK